MANNGVNRSPTQPSNATHSAGDYIVRSQIVDASGNVTDLDNITVAQTAASAAAVTQVASSATNVTLKAANTSRKGLSIFNDSTQVVYVKFGATASTSSYTVKVAAGGYYEIPYTPVYTGIVDGIWASSNGNAYVTELT